MNQKQSTDLLAHMEALWNRDTHPTLVRRPLVEMRKGTIIATRAHGTTRVETVTKIARTREHVRVETDKGNKYVYILGGPYVTKIRV